MVIVLKGNPISVNALYRGRRFLTSTGKAIKKDYGYQIKRQYKGKVLEKGLVVSVWVYFKSGKQSDLDNVLKATFDSLTGFVWKDDKQIMEIRAFKLQDKLNPRVELEITEI